MTWQRSLIISFMTYALPLSAATLDLQQAICKIKEQNKSLMSAETEIQMKLAEAWQTGLLPNPLLAVGINDFGGSGHYRGMKHAEYSVSLTQPFDLSGKRNARQMIALAAVYKSSQAYETAKQEILKDLKSAFVNAYALQEHLKIMIEQHQITEELHACTKEKASAGKVPAFYSHRLSMACQASLLALEKIKSELKSVYSAIAALFSAAYFCFDEVSYPFFNVEPPASYSTYSNNIQNNPALAAAQTDIYAATNIHQLEKANRIPDLDVTAEITTRQDNRDNYFSVTLSIPIPVFDRNDGNVCRSSWQTWQARYAEEDLEARMQRRLAEVYGKLTSSYAAAMSLAKEIQNCSNETLEANDEIYHHGKIERTDWLEARKMCLEIRDQYIETLKEFHLSRIEIEHIAPSTRGE